MVYKLPNKKDREIENAVDKAISELFNLPKQPQVKVRKSKEGN